MSLVTREEASSRLRVSPVSLGDRRYRRRIGLPVVRVGRRLFFDEVDIRRVIDAGRETLHGGGSPVGALGEQA